MKRLILLFFLIPSFAFAGTVSGIHKEDGVVAEGYFVSVYSFGAVEDYAIDNATLVGTDTTDASGAWSVTTTLTTKHLVIIKDTANDVKKAVQIFATPE